MDVAQPQLSGQYSLRETPASAATDRSGFNFHGQLGSVYGVDSSDPAQTGTTGYEFTGPQYFRVGLDNFIFGLISFKILIRFIIL